MAGSTGLAASPRSEGDPPRLTREPRKGPHGTGAEAKHAARLGLPVFAVFPSVCGTGAALPRLLSVGYLLGRRPCLALATNWDVAEDLSSSTQGALSHNKNRMQLGDDL